MTRLSPLLVAALVSTNLGAQEICKPDDTLLACWARIAPEQADENLLEKTSTETKKKENVDLKRLPTGLDTSGLTLDTNTKNFLPLLTLSGLLGEATKDETSGNLIFDLNFLIPGLGEDKNTQLQLVVNTEPEIAEGIKMALPEEGRDEQVSKLEEGVSEADDYTLSFTYSLTGRNAGRGPNQYRELFGALLRGVERKVRESYSSPLAGVDRDFDRLEEAMDAVNFYPIDTTDPDLLTFEEVGNAWIGIRTRQLETTVGELFLCGRNPESLTEAQRQELRKQFKELHGDLDETSFRSVWTKYGDSCEVEQVRESVILQLQEWGIDPSEERRQIQSIGESLGGREMRLLLIGVEKEAKTARDEVLDHQNAINDAGLNVFADLVNNQRQLYFTAKGRFRDELVGGDEMSLRVTYEWAAANLTASMPRKCHDGIETEDEEEDCLSTYETFVDNHRGSVKNGNRFSFSGEYLEVDEVTVDLPEQEIADIKLEGAKKVIVSAGWSRMFRTSLDSQPLRLDLVAKYEDVSDDPARQNRGVATLTVTRQFGDITIPFGVVYANRSEFLTDVDEKLSAHIGLKFNLNTIGQK